MKFLGGGAIFAGYTISFSNFSRLPGLSVLNGEETKTKKVILVCALVGFLSPGPFSFNTPYYFFRLFSPSALEMSDGLSVSPPLRHLTFSCFSLQCCIFFFLSGYPLLRCYYKVFTFSSILTP